MMFPLLCNHVTTGSKGPERATFWLRTRNNHILVDCETIDVVFLVVWQVHFLQTHPIGEESDGGVIKS